MDCSWREMVRLRRRHYGYPAPYGACGRVNECLPRRRPAVANARRTPRREVATDCWDDAEKLTHNEISRRIAGQLYAAVSSIAANLGEGYSRSSGRDRAKIFEYALGSTRESMMWYRIGVRILGREVVASRLEKLEEIRRLLLAIIPRERGRLIRPKNA